MISYNSTGCDIADSDLAYHKHNIHVFFEVCSAGGFDTTLCVPDLNGLKLPALMLLLL